MSSRKYVIVDLDGTLYNSVKRVHLAQARLWDDFHQASIQDEPHMDVLELINALNPDISVIAVTGRNNAYANLTREWLKRYNVPISGLLMRADEDWRSDTDVKIALLEKLFGDKETVLSSVICVLEDRDKMVEAYRNYGLSCWQVRAGGY